jgi:putative tricarboxylic transport membrane protein
MNTFYRTVRPVLTSLLVAVTVGPALISGAAAQDPLAPDRPVEIIVPSAPGGGLDVTARALQAVVQQGKLMEQPTVVINKPGGSTALGVAYLNEHPGDGGYICIQAPPMVTNAIVGLSDIDIEDVTPLGLLFEEDIIFSVKSDSRFADGKALVKQLLADPQSVSIGISSALGAHSHLATALLMKAAGGDPSKLKVVVFGSGSEAAIAVLGGHVDVAVTPASSILGHKEAGTLRVIGVPSEKRGIGALADAPTWKEQGVDYVFGNWRFVLGPKDMTPPQIAYWDGVLSKVVEQPEWKKLTLNNNWTPAFRNSSELRTFLIKQRAELTTILRDLGMTPKT